MDLSPDCVHECLIDKTRRGFTQLSSMTDIAQPTNTSIEDEPIIDVFEKYVSAMTAIDTGLIGGAEYILDRLIIECERFYADNNIYHEMHTRILEQLYKIYVIKKSSNEANKVLHTILDIDPDNIRSYYRLFNLYRDSFSHERESLDTYLKACEIIKRRGKSHPDYEIFKTMKLKGEALRSKRSFYAILDNSTEEIQKQNLFKQLPIEIISNIMKKLNQSDLFNMLSICKDWRSGILGSPFLISLYTIEGHLNVKIFQSYLRIFDQLSPISDIILNYFEIIDLDHKLFKLILSSNLSATNVHINLTKMHSTNFNKIITEFKDSKFLRNIQHLKLSLNHASSFLDASTIMRHCPNLKSLKIVATTTGTDLTPNLMIDPLNLPHLREVEFSSFNSSVRNKMWALFKAINTKNITKLKLIGEFGALARYFKRTENVVDLRIENGRIRNALGEGIFSADVNLNNLEVLTLDKCHGDGELSNNNNSFPSLKHLSIIDTDIDNYSFVELYTSIKETLESLEIYGWVPLNLDSNRTIDFEDLMHNGLSGASVISLKQILTESKKLKKFIIKGKLHKTQFEKVIIDIATSSEPIRLEVLELDINSPSAENHILMLLTTKSKLYVDELWIDSAHKTIIKPFLDQAILDKSIGSYKFTSDTVH